MIDPDEKDQHGMPLTCRAVCHLTVYFTLNNASDPNPHHNANPNPRSLAQ